MDKKEKLELRQSQDQIQQNPDGSLELGSDIEAKVSELVGDDVSNDLPNNTQSSQSQDDKKIQEKISLREQLLRTAPEEKVMRAEVVAKLNKDRNILEKGLAKIKNSDQFELIVEVMRELRAVIREINRVMSLHYEALKIVWLRVVHNF